MTHEQAKAAEQAFRSLGYDVTAQQSRIARLGYELVGKAADNDKPVYGFSPRDMQLLVASGQVARI